MYEPKFQRYYKIVTLSVFELPLLPFTIVYALVVTLIWIMLLLTGFTGVSVWRNDGVLTNMTSLRAVRLLAGSFVTVLFIPAVRMLFSVFTCVGAGPAWKWNPTIQCFSTAHLPYVIVSLVTLVPYLLLSLFMSYTVFDFNPRSKNPLARPHSQFEMFYQVCKLIFAFVFVFNNAWARLVVFVVLLLVLCLVFIYAPPYFSVSSNYRRAGIYFSLIAGGFWSIAALAVQGRDPGDRPPRWMFYALWPVLVVGGALGMVVCRVAVRSRITWALTAAPASSVYATASSNSNNRVTPADVPSESDSSSVRFSSGSHPDAPLPRFAFQVQLTTRFVITDPTPDKVALAKSIYEAAMARWPTYPKIVIAYAKFVLEYNTLFPVRLADPNNEVRALLSRAARLPGLWLDDRFVIFHMRKAMSEAAQASALGAKGAVDMMAFVEYRKHSRAAQVNHAAAREGILKFWKALESGNASRTSLAAIAKYVDEKESKATEAYEVLLDRFKSSPQLLREYALYLEEVHADLELADDCLELADEIEEASTIQDADARTAPLNSGTAVSTSQPNLRGRRATQSGSRLGGASSVLSRSSAAQRVEDASSVGDFTSGDHSSGTGLSTQVSLLAGRRGSKMSAGVLRLVFIGWLMLLTFLILMPVIYSVFVPGVHHVVHEFDSIDTAHRRNIFSLDALYGIRSRALLFNTTASTDSVAGALARGVARNSTSAALRLHQSIVVKENAELIRLARKGITVGVNQVPVLDFIPPDSFSVNPRTSIWSLVGEFFVRTKQVLELPAPAANFPFPVSFDRDFRFASDNQMTISFVFHSGTPFHSDIAWYELGKMLQTLSKLLYALLGSFGVVISLFLVFWFLVIDEVRALRLFLNMPDQVVRFQVHAYEAMVARASAAATGEDAAGANINVGQPIPVSPIPQGNNNNNNNNNSNSGTLLFGGPTSTTLSAPPPRPAGVTPATRRVGGTGASTVVPAGTSVSGERRRTQGAAGNIVIASERQSWRNFLVNSRSITALVCIGLVITLGLAVFNSGLVEIEAQKSSDAAAVAETHSMAIRTLMLSREAFYNDTFTWGIYGFPILKDSNPTMSLPSMRSTVAALLTNITYGGDLGYFDSDDSDSYLGRRSYIASGFINYPSGAKLFFARDGWSLARAYLDALEKFIRSPTSYDALKELFAAATGGTPEDPQLARPGALCGYLLEQMAVVNADFKMETDNRIAAFGIVFTLLIILGVVPYIVVYMVLLPRDLLRQSRRARQMLALIPVEFLDDPAMQPIRNFLLRSTDDSAASGAASKKKAEASKEGTLVLDASGYVISADSAVLRILDASESDLIHNSAAPFFPTLNIDEFDKGDASMTGLGSEPDDSADAVRRRLPVGGPFAVKVVSKRKRVIPSCRVYKGAMPGPGGQQVYVYRLLPQAKTRDMNRSTAAQAQDLFQSLLQHSNEGLLALNATGRIVFANVAAGAILRAVPATLVGRALADVVWCADEDEGGDIDDGGDVGGGGLLAAHRPRPAPDAALRRPVELPTEPGELCKAYFVPPRVAGQLVGQVLALPVWYSSARIVGEDGGEGFMVSLSDPEGVRGNNLNNQTNQDLLSGGDGGAGSSIRSHPTPSRPAQGPRSNAAPKLTAKALALSSVANSPALPGAVGLPLATDADDPFSADPRAVVTTDGNGLIISINQTFSEHFGYRRSALVGEAVAELLAGSDETIFDLSSPGAARPKRALVSLPDGSNCICVISLEPANNWSGAPVWGHIFQRQGK